MVRAFGKLLLMAGWAPVAVLIFHAIIAKTSLREPLDFLMHSLGGASMAFLFFMALRLMPMVFGTPSAFGRYFFSFTFACTVGVFWEFLEMFLDIYRHTHIQQSLYETMWDLIADATGAGCVLLVIWGWRQFRSRRLENR